MNPAHTHLPPLPDGLRQRLEADAQRFLAERNSPTVAPAVAPARAPESERPRSGGEPRERGGPPVLSLLGWVVAAAASAVLLLRQPSVPEEGPARTLAEELENLRASSGSLALSWTATEDPLSGAATGTVVWNAEQQRGYMRFEGLPVNEVTKSQYQLWIFDSKRPEATPVDGGVFDIDGADVLVPIDPKLEVFEPTLFAITLEEPGGVVVSEREHLLLVASVD